MYLALVPISVTAQVETQQPKVLPQPIQQLQINAEETTTPIPKEVELTFEQKHKDEDSIFLLYDVTIEVNEDWSYTEKMHKKLKILKERAKSMGEIPVFYEKGREKVTDIEAHTITPDGEKHRYSRIQDFRTREGYRMYSDYRYKIITMPEVNVGSIIEYEATITSKGKPVKDAFWYYTDFSSNIPIKEHKFTIIFPKSLGIKYKEFNLAHKPTITETDSTVTYAWYIQDIGDLNEGFRESHLPPPRLEDIRDFVEFSSINSWKDISDWYYYLIQKNLKVNKRIEKVVAKTLKGHTNTKDKVRAVLEYLQENFRYVSMSFGDNTLEPHPTDQIFRHKYGDCKDLSLLCMAMLKLGGVKSHIALFNNEFSITAPEQDLPFPSLFNHVVLLVEDPEEGDFYIDPLLDGYDIGEYPFSYQAAYTFVITEDGGKFDRLPVFDEKRYYSRKKLVNTINPDGSALVEVESLWTLDFSIEVRSDMKDVSTKEKEKFFEELDASYGNVLERRWTGLEEKYGAIDSYIKYERQDMFPITDDMIIIDISNVERIADYSKKERKNPVFHHANQLQEVTTVYKIPEGFRISYVPKNLDLDIGFFSYRREYEKKEKELVITETTRFKRMELPAKEYPRIRGFFDRYPKEVNQRIVFKKIKPWWQEIEDIISRVRKEDIAK